MRKIADLSWLELDEIEKEKSRIVIPIASIEQHGYHLPIATDYLIMEAVLGHENGIMSKHYQQEMLVTPIIPFGLSPEHSDFTGTISLEATTIFCLLDNIVYSLAKNGFKNFVILNTHGGNTAPLQIVVRDLHLKYNIAISHIDLLGSKFFADMDKITEGEFLDIHAGEYETSMIMYLYPELVNLDFPKEKLKQNIKQLPNGWLTKELSVTGVLGDATLSSKDKGEKYFSYIIDHLFKLLNY